jgi:hypothetical protein
VVLVASGALSHTFCRCATGSTAGDTAHLHPEARQPTDRIAWSRPATTHAFRHDARVPAVRRARFGHYLQMMGALGEGAVTAPARQHGEYENSIGTDRLPGSIARPRLDRDPAGAPA